MTTTTATNTATTTTAGRQDRLLELLACPLCRSTLELTDAVVRHDGVAAGDLWCAIDGRVGVIDNHRPSFLDRDLSAYAPGTGASRRCEMTAGSDMISTAGRWWSIPEGWAGTAEPGVAMIVVGTFRSVSFEIMRDRWSPHVELVVDGEVRGVYNLADQNGGNALTCLFETNAERTVMLRIVSSVPAGRMVVTDTRIEVDAAARPAPGIGPVDRGSRYPLAFLDLLKATPVDGVALDCGAGDRRLDDPRLINIDHQALATTDVYADCLKLPFADESVDLILSQSVLEYLPDPLHAVDEMHRVLKPGGQIYGRVSFGPSADDEAERYFTMTSHGAEYLFHDWTIESLEWFGGLSQSVEEWTRIIDLDGPEDQERLAATRSLVADIDLRAPRERLKQLATGLSIVATRP